MVDLARWFDEEYRIELPFPPPPGVILDRDREESDG